MEDRKVQSLFKGRIRSGSISRIKEPVGKCELWIEGP